MMIPVKFYNQSKHLMFSLDVSAENLDRVAHLTDSYNGDDLNFVQSWLKAFNDVTGFDVKLEGRSVSTGFHSDRNAERLMKDFSVEVVLET